jgi:hypothetical protein
MVISHRHRTWPIEIDDKHDDLHIETGDFNWFLVVDSAQL